MLVAGSQETTTTRTYRTENSATATLKRVRNLDRKAQNAVNSALDAVAVQVRAFREEILQEVSSWVEGLPEHLSEDDFFDAIKLLRREEVSDDLELVDLEPFSDKAVCSWCNRESSPEPVQRKAIIVALFRSCLEFNRVDGGDYVREHVELARWTPSLEASGQPPSSVVKRPDGRVQIVEVILPPGLSWKDHVKEVCGVDRLEESVRKLVNHLQLVELICLREHYQKQSLRRRLQSHKGVGTRGARKLEEWLEQIGCQILSNVPSHGASVLNADR